MKRIVIFGVAIAILLLTGISCTTNNEKEKAAVTSAEKWLALIDTGKYSESWQEANEYFRESVQQDQWEKIIWSVRTPLGKVISRELKTKIYKKESPGEPQGRYIIIQYATSFQNKNTTTKEIVDLFDNNGRWIVSGYHLK
jgi:hypothetical protein